MSKKKIWPKPKRLLKEIKKGNAAVIYRDDKPVAMVLPYSAWELLKTKVAEAVAWQLVTEKQVVEEQVEPVPDTNVFAFRDTDPELREAIEDMRR